jgi:cytochrome c553
MAGRGAALYEAHACFRCHETARADANTVPVPLDAVATKYDVASLAAFLSAPQPPMPLFPLTDAERRDVAAHLLLRAEP